MQLGLRDCERLPHLVGAVASLEYLKIKGFGNWPAAELCRGLPPMIDSIVMLLRMRGRLEGCNCPSCCSTMRNVGIPTSGSYVENGQCSQYEWAELVV
jgi:hypothetical protein